MSKKTLNGADTDKYLLPYKGDMLSCDRVTTILGATKGSGGLAQWYGREERKAIQEIVSWLPTVSMLKEDERQFAEVEGIRTAVLSLPTDDDDDLFASRIRDSKADSGTNIHTLINIDATGQKLPADVVITEDEWRRFTYWDKFRRDEGIEYVDSEMRVYSPNLLVAGTLDLTFKWKEVFWLGDTKTGRLKRDAAVQSVIYWLLRQETLAIQTGDVDTQMRFARDYKLGIVPEVEWPRFGIVHIEDERVEFYEVDPKLPNALARNFMYRLYLYRQDQVMRPFRRLHPAPRVLKDGTSKQNIWLRAS